MKYEQPFDQPSNPDAGYVNANPAAGIQGSIPPARAFEDHQRELVALITAAGFSPDETDLKQVIRAIRQGVTYCGLATAVGGNPNTLTAVTTANGKPALQGYLEGLSLVIKIPADNTGSATLAVDGLSAVTICRANGANVAAGDLPNGSVVLLRYDGSKFQVQNYFGFSSTTTNNNTFTVDIPYADDTSLTPNSIVTTYSPAITTLNKGDFLSTKLKNTLTGPATINVNGLPAKPIVRHDSSPCQRNDAFVNEMLLLAFDGTNFQIVNTIGVPPLPALIANADWYVDGSIGNDSSYDGTSATVSGTHGPFRTVNRAMGEVVRYNMNGYSQNIHIAAGTYTEAVGGGTQNGSGQVNIIGAGVAATAIVGTSGHSAMQFAGFGRWSITTLSLTSGAGPGIGGDPVDCLYCQQGAVVSLGWVRFGGAYRAQVSSQLSAFVSASSTLEFYGGGVSCFIASQGGNISTPGQPQFPDLVIPAPVNWTSGFMNANLTSQISFVYNSVTGYGNVNGYKFVTSSNSVINSNGNGVNYFPGTVAGIAVTGGQYI